jgi:large subunit ribosomal protein L10
MNRQQKVEVIEHLKESFANTQASFLVGFQGLTVAQMQELRGELRKEGGKLKVTKARLMKRAADTQAGTKEIVPLFKGQVGIVFSTKESPAIAKVLFEYAKKNEALKLIAGSMDQMFLDASSIGRIATLPSKEVLLAQVCGTIQAPLASFVTVLNMQVLRLLWTLKQVGDKKQ